VYFKIYKKQSLGSQNEDLLSFGFEVKVYQVLKQEPHPYATKNLK